VNPTAPVAAALVALLLAPSALAGELVYVTPTSRYGFEVVNSSPYRLEVQIGDKAPITLDPGRRHAQTRGKTKRGSEITVRYTEPAWQALHEREVAARDEAMRALLEVDQKELAWGTPEAAKERLDRAERGFRNEVTGVMALAGMADGIFGQEQVYFLEDDTLYTAWQDNLFAQGIIQMIAQGAIEQIRAKYKAALRPPNFNAERAKLQKKIEEIDARIAANDEVFAAAQGAENAWSDAFDPISLDRVHYPKGDVTPYASVDVGFTIIKPELGNDWERRGTMSMHLGGALPLMPEIRLNHGDTSWYLRLMGTAGFERLGGALDSDNSYAVGDLVVGSEGGSASMVYEVMPVGGQLRVSFLPWGFVDLGAGYNVYTGSAVRASIGEEESSQSFSERGVVRFDKTDPAQNVYGQVRAAVLLGGGRNERHAGGMFMSVSSKLFQLPGVTPTGGFDVYRFEGGQAALPEAGRWMADLRFSVGIAL
jgi:hypothetical protein